MNLGYSWVLVAIMAVITVLLRAAPLLGRRWLGNNYFIERLNQNLPGCVMVILVCSSLTTASATATPFFREIGALVIVALSYLLWRKALVSVILGVALLSLLFEVFP
ncbi:MAG TPA: AzlD domain-containing protein [Caballeronia sp.]|jgi:branched-subunit amino acid transport protein AzlD|nr:AzlD domain-containing protein [Caballeronia sp.]